MRAVQNLLQWLGSFAVLIGATLLVCAFVSNIVRPIVQDYWEEAHPHAAPSAPLNDPTWFKGAIWHQSRTHEEQKEQVESINRSRQALEAPEKQPATSE